MLDNTTCSVTILPIMLVASEPPLSIYRLQYLDMQDRIPLYQRLRINVDENNYEYVSDLFNIILEDKRKKVTLNMCNIFKNKSRISLYELYKKAIDKGYRFYDTINNCTKCEASSKNSFTIQPDGKVVFCSISGENGYDFGELNLYLILYFP
jgi:hypothetical protein